MVFWILAARCLQPRTSSSWGSAEQRWQWHQQLLGAIVACVYVCELRSAVSIKREKDERNLFKHWYKGNKAASSSSSFICFLSLTPLHLFSSYSHLITSCFHPGFLIYHLKCFQRFSVCNVSNLLFLLKDKSLLSWKGKPIDTLYPTPKVLWTRYMFHFM